MADCKACTERGKPENYGSEPKCAFRKSGRLFGTDNWNCATLNELREAIHNTHTTFDLYNDDETLWIVSLLDQEWTFLILGHYKQRGTVHTLILLDGQQTPKIRPTLKSIEEILNILTGG